MPGDTSCLHEAACLHTHSRLPCGLPGYLGIGASIGTWEMDTHSSMRHNTQAPMSTHHRVGSNAVNAPRSYSYVSPACSSLIRAGQPPLPRTLPRRTHAPSHLLIANTRGVVAYPGIWTRMGFLAATTACFLLRCAEGCHVGRGSVASDLTLKGR